MFVLNKNTNLYHVFPSGSDLLCRTEHTCVHAQCLFVCMRLWDGVACRGVSSHSKDESAACIYPWPDQRHREDLCHFENEVFIKYKQPLFLAVLSYFMFSHLDHVNRSPFQWKIITPSQVCMRTTFLSSCMDGNWRKPLWSSVALMSHSCCSPCLSASPSISFFFSLMCVIRRVWR